MTDAPLAKIVSDRSDRSDRLDIASLFRSDTLDALSDRSDRVPSPASTSPTGPTCAAFCRTGIDERNQHGPTGPTENAHEADVATAYALAEADAERLRGGCGWAGWPNADHALDRPSAADLDAFEERAAVAEHDGGLARADAERAAAEALGFADAGALFEAAADGWRRNLEALARRETSQRGRECIAAALRFIADGWGEKAAALGWPEIELFGADPAAPWERLDRLGAAYLAFASGTVTAECIGYHGRGCTPVRRWRASQADGAVLPWPD